MPGSAVRFLSAVGFNIIVAVIFHFFGASLSTCWFTFLGLTLFAGLGEVDRHMEVLDSKLDSILKEQQRQEESNAYRRQASS
jgi:hypothetical protein